MSFLFPLYLLGAAALAVPIFLHLRRRPPKEHVEFGSLMFLQKTPERVTRRTKLEQLLLLALRCFAILLLAFAFGRPFLASIQLPSEGASLTRALVLVDRSASMRRDGFWEAATAAARDALRRYGSGDEVAVAFFDEDFHLAADLPTFAGLGAGARAAAFDRLLEGKTGSPSWLGTDLGGAMTKAANLLLGADATLPADRREIVVVSDFQSGAERGLLNENPWPSDVRVLCLPVGTETGGNLSLTLAASPPRANIDEAEVYRVRLTNAVSSESARAVLSWKGFPETETEVLVAPGTGRILSTPPRPAGAERGTLVVGGDTHDFDNEVHIAPVQPRPLRLLYLGKESEAESAGSPLFYLSRALQPTPALRPIVTASENLAELSTEMAEVVVASGIWTEEAATRLHDFADSGGLVLALPSPELPSAALASLTGESGWSLAKAPARDFALLAKLDFDHPVLAPFARAQIRDFTKIRFWQHARLEGVTPGERTRVLAEFDSGTPAILEHRVGEGAVFAFLAGWRPAESQLALSSKFVPLLYSVFDHAGYSIRSAPTLYVGETEHESVGFFEEPALADGGEARLVAVNLAPAEGRTDPFDPAVEFAALGIPLIDAAANEPAPELSAAQKLRVESEQKEENQKLWKWLVFAALLVLIFETWLAGRRATVGVQVSDSTAKAAA